ncbi:Lon protease family protein [Methylotenera mobilis]|uniref:endopeptidase La n=1 Tax=Methylotenera mobilis (strain JLW8 / ATCC BAA-1282 / DSM 17540) TaxID=583345 RepID=C6WVI0_METML|nr:AAA family ATPase [Methylotenera mobilis]ACT47929.1 ATP-dependent protease-like protein [Methylotenera mobilis JLW8]
MQKILTPQELTLNVARQQFNFADTSALIAEAPDSAQYQAWVAQAEAKKAAEFGLSIQQTGFNLLALGEPGSGRTTLMLSVMHEAAKKWPAACDLVALYQFEASGKPLFIKLPAGAGTQLKQALDTFVRVFAKELASLLDAKVQQNSITPLQTFIDEQLNTVKASLTLIEPDKIPAHYFSTLQKDILETLETWQPTTGPEGESNLEALMSESFFGRYRANVLVEHHATQHAPVLYDNDPSLQSLFGGIEGASEASNIPDFMRLRAGNLMRADGGTLLLHLRDILADEQNGAHILEKLHRFLRNGTLQIEDLSSSSNQGSSLISAQAAIPVSVKIVLITTREDYYELLGVKPDFFDYFPIKIEFADQVKASAENYAAYASFIAHKCQQHHCRHVTADAVAALLQAMHRLIEDQTRLSTKFAVLEKLLLESAAAASLRGAELVTIEDVKSAIQRKYARHSYIEAHMRDSIVDKELIISVHGDCIGQINGLTHIDLSEASFGSPVRISANCYPGSRGVLTIDREVKMSGPTHDKGVMILQSWLHTNFAHLNPLNLTASLVFEQEYSGVDGDSASCAELFALLSSLAQVPIKQGIAVTGAMNQHGEVLPVGGLNEKIEGYFRVCKEIGLDGNQGVLMPERNMRHLMLSDEVIQAVEQGQFHIATMNNVADGIQYLTGHSLQSVNVMAEVVLKDFKIILETNFPKRPA